MYTSMRVASKIYSEEYVVTFWDRTGEFIKQKKQSYFFASKGRHAYARYLAIRDFNLKDADVISVTYQ